jgi:hypothetical protein
MRVLHLIVLTVSGAIAGSTAVRTQPSDAASASACFLRSNFVGWRSPNPNTIYIRVRPERYYRLDLAGECPELRTPTAHLINESRGKNTICSPLDWDIRVEAPGGGGPQQCIVKAMTQLNASEAAAIPKAFKP